MIYKILKDGWMEIGLQDAIGTIHVTKGADVQDLIIATRIMGKGFLCLVALDPQPMRPLHKPVAGCVRFQWAHLNGLGWIELWCGQQFADRCIILSGSRN
jgi:hypothetical protein